MRAAEQSSKASIMRADKAEAKRLDKMRDEIATFWARSEERQARRQAVMDRIAADEAPAIAAEILAAKQQAATK